MKNSNIFSLFKLFNLFKISDDPHEIETKFIIFSKFPRVQIKLNQSLHFVLNFSKFKQTWTRIYNFLEIFMLLRKLNTKYSILSKSLMFQTKSKKLQYFKNFSQSKHNWTKNHNFFEIFHDTNKIEHKIFNLFKSSDDPNEIEPKFTIFS